MTTSAESVREHDGVTLVTADAEAGIQNLPEDSVDCLVTSPRYWRLRDYAPDTWTGGRPGCCHRSAGTGVSPGDRSTGRWWCRVCGALRERPQIGLEPTADDYVETLRAVFAAARRVLRPRATMWVNLGDSYSTNSDGYWCSAAGLAGQPRYRPRADVPHKNSLGMPWRLAFALQDDGWILRSAIVWHKPHATPVVTSPPYWGLRDYRVPGQYGQEPTLDGYVDTLFRVFDELSRVLRSSGTVWLNLGDSYGGSWGNYVATGSQAATVAQRAGWRYGTHRPPQTGARAEDLQGIPWRVALALAERGWQLRNAIVWVKSNARPEGVRDRLAQRYEMVFLLTRSPMFWLAPQERTNGDVGDVWRFASPRSRWSHIAVGPLELARRCIRYGCPPGGLVLDPFVGSGTTAVAARTLGRRFAGIDIDPASRDLVIGRLREHGVV